MESLIQINMTPPKKHWKLFLFDVPLGMGADYVDLVTDAVTRLKRLGYKPEVVKGKEVLEEYLPDRK